MSRRARARFAALSTTIALACGPVAACIPADWSDPPEPAGSPPRVMGTVATGLDTPWGLAFLPDGTAIVTERDTGRVLLLSGDTRGITGTRAEVTEIGRIRQVSEASDEAGLLGVAVSPDFASDNRLWFYVTTEHDNRVVTTTYDDGRIGTVRPVLTGIPTGWIHDGGRLEFGPDGYLYVSTGETGNGELAPDRSSLGGKVLRITREGAPAPGNPDTDSPVWSWGHRNIQGLAFDDTGALWASEFGANAYDELNLISRGRDYGWPSVEGKGGEGAMVDPQLVWSTDEASPSGLAFADGHLWMAALRGERLWRVTLTDGRATAADAFFIGDHGRMRTVVTSPTGDLWVTTSNRDGRGDPRKGDDRILVVHP
jgi:glucose/arabinose dehydrogenase